MSEVLETEAAIERHVAIMPPLAGVVVVVIGGGAFIVVEVFIVSVFGLKHKY